MNCEWSDRLISFRRFSAAWVVGLVIAAFCRAVPECPAADVPQVTASISVDRDHIYPMDPFKVTWTIRSAGVRLGSQFRFTDLAGENEIELLDDGFEQLATKRSVVNRATHTVIRFRRRARAKRAGKITLAPVIYGNRIFKMRGFESRTSFAIKATPLIVQVHPVPEAGRPESFSGAIGRLSFDVEMTPTELALGDLVTATMRVEGEGFLDELKPPVISPGRNFKVYDLKEQERVPGKRVFEQIVVPQNSNAVEISAVSFSFFDTDARRYRMVTRGPFPLKFRAAKQESDVPYVSSEPPDKTPPPESVTPSADLPSFQDVPHYRGIVTALSFSLICAILIGLWLVLKVRHRGAIALLSVVIALQAAALCYAIGHGLLGRSRSTVGRMVSARLAPARSALVSFKVPRGASVAVVESHGAWRKIELKDKRGWIHSEALATPGPDPGR